MQTKFTINKLSAEFYARYPAAKFPEIEQKPDRPYIVLVITIGSNTFALPLRTNIRHSYCYKFKRTGRNTSSASGIDFTKAVIVNDANLIGATVTMDNLEYLELVQNFQKIIKNFEKFVNDYISFCKNGGGKFAYKKYQFTTLKYFKSELGL